MRFESPISMVIIMPRNSPISIKSKNSRGASASSGVPKDATLTSSSTSSDAPNMNVIPGPLKLRFQVASGSPISTANDSQSGPSSDTRIPSADRSATDGMSF